MPRTTVAHAILLGHNFDILAMVPILFDHVGVSVRTVMSVEEMLAAIHRDQPSFLIVDCVGVEDASARCRAVIGHTTLPVHICHPEREFVDDLQPQARGKLYWLPPPWTGLSLFEKVRTLLAEAASAATSAPDLTTREHEVMDLVAAGKDNTAIAHDLGITKETVKDHVHSLMVKYEVTTRPELIVAHNTRG